VIQNLFMRANMTGQPVAAVYSYDVIRVEKCWPGPEFVDADDPFSFPLDHDSYAKHEWAGPMKPPQ